MGRTYYTTNEIPDNTVGIAVFPIAARMGITSPLKYANPAQVAQMWSYTMRLISPY